MCRTNFFLTKLMLLLLCPLILNAQEEIPIEHNCGFEQLYIQDSTYSFRIEQMEEEILQRQYQSKPPIKDIDYKSNGTDVDNVIYTIPVVVHIVHRSGMEIGSEENFTDAEIASKIDFLNEAFAHTSGKVIPNPYGGVDTGIRFCLAKRDPEGNPHTGINRYENDYLTYDKIAGLAGPVTPSYQWDPLQYMNIFVVFSIEDGYHAYANLASEHGKPHDGLVIAHYVHNYIWVHEVGHYLNLYHTFNGGSTSACPANYDCQKDGDRVCDTPPHKRQFIYCEEDLQGNEVLNSCSFDTADPSPNNPFTTDIDDPLYNYMTYDFCRDHFTIGQRTRMRDAIINYRSSLLSSNVCTPFGLANDIGINRAIAPNGLSCEDNFTPIIELSNNGSAPVTEATISVLLDGVFYYNYNWTGNLAPNETVEVELNSLTATAFGSHNVYFCLSDASGNPIEDDYSLNDQLYQEFARSNVYTLNESDPCLFTTSSNENTITTYVAPPPCDYFRGNDVWFEIIVPPSGHINFEADYMDFEDGGAALYKGTCTALELLVCDENSGVGLMPQINAFGLEPGSTVYIRFWERNNNDFGDFGVCVTDGQGEIPDFELSNPEVSSSVSSIFGGINFSFDVGNVSNTNSSTDISIGLFFSEDNTWSPDDFFLNYIDVNKEDLKTGNSISVDKGVYMPAFSTPNQTYYLIAVADYHEFILEPNETNNIVYKAISLEGGTNHLADLYSTDERIFPHTVPQSGDLYVAANYHNGGVGATDRTYLRYYLSSDTLWNAPDTYLGSNRQGGFSPNESEFLSTKLFIPNSVQPGEYYVLFISDENDHCFETNENNNIKRVPITISNTVNKSDFYFRLYLEGFYDPATQLMNSSLNQNFLLPNHHAYLGSPWYHDGAENLVNIPFDAVDWVIVQAVKGNPASQNVMELVETRAGLLMEDGWIVDLDGVSPLSFYDLSLYDQYHFIIRHRSHIDVMTSNAFTPSYTSTQEHNFTNAPTKAYGPSQQKEIGNNKYGIISGDFDGNGVINNLDFNLWTQNNALVNEYISWDADGNATVNNLDFNLWTTNASKIGINHIGY